MERTLTSEARRALVLGFRKAGFTGVQSRLSRDEPSQLFGTPEIPGARELARHWLVEQMEKERRRRTRSKLLLTGTTILVFCLFGLSVLAFSA